jgi:hypothetical protein
MRCWAVGTTNYGMVAPLNLLLPSAGAGFGAWTVPEGTPAPPAKPLLPSDRLQSECASDRHYLHQFYIEALLSRKPQYPAEGHNAAWYDADSWNQPRQCPQSCTPTLLFPHRCRLFSEIWGLKAVALPTRPACTPPCTPPCISY